MHCDECGKENREGSKFCRSCGVSLGAESVSSSEKKNTITEFKLNWKNPIVTYIIGVVVVIGLLYGGYNANAYIKISSKINTAEKLQRNKDYTGSLSILNTLDSNYGTENQKKEIAKLKEDNQKFSDYKTLFDNTVAKISSTSTVKDLKSAQTDLQSISSTYPDYNNVQTKLTEIGGWLMTALENDSAASKALAEKSRQAAASAQAAKDKAEANAQAAISSANTLADQARGEEVLKSFSNQLLSIRNSFSKSVDDYTSYLNAYNKGDYSLASVYAGAVINGCYAVQTNSKNLRDNFTGLPSSYKNASIDMEWAGYYLCESIDSWSDRDYSSSKNEANKMLDYYSLVDNFLGI